MGDLAGKISKLAKNFAKDYSKKVKDSLTKNKNVNELDESIFETENSPVKADGKNGDNVAKALNTFLEYSMGQNEQLSSDEEEYDEEGRILSQKLKSGDDYYLLTYQYDSGNFLNHADLIKLDKDENIKEKSSMKFSGLGIIRESEISQYDEDGEISDLYTARINDKYEIEYTNDIQYELEDNEFDGIITSEKQNKNLDDCWLLAGLNSLSYTKAGKELIKESLVKNTDGTVSIYFKGINYRVDLDKESLIKKANQGKLQLSEDLDACAIEEAARVALKAAENGEIKLYGKPEWCGINDGYKRDDALGMRSYATLLYMYTGKSVMSCSRESYASQYEQNLDKTLDDFQNNPETSTMCISFEEKAKTEEIKIQDSEGNEKQLRNMHAYSIKRVEGDKVVLVDPEDSSKEYYTTRDVLFNYTAEYINYQFKDSSKA